MNNHYWFWLLFSLMLFPLVMALNGSSVDYNAQFNLSEGSFDANSSSGYSGSIITSVDFNSSGGSYNASGNFSFLTDNTAPTVTITSPITGFSTTNTSITLVYSGFDDGGITKYFVQADGGSLIDNNLNASYVFSSQTIGTHTYSVKALDGEGLYSTVKSVNVIISAPSSTPPSGGNNGGGGGGGGGSNNNPVVSLKGAGSFCSDGSECVSGTCINQTCSECLSDSDCADNETCSLGVCKVPSGTCGKTINHQFVSFECCSNSDCSKGYYCESTTQTCAVSKEPVLLISFSPVEPILNQSVSVLVRASDQNDSEITLSVDDQNYLYTPPSFDFLALKKTYTIRASKKGYLSDEVKLTVKKKMFIRALNENPREGELVSFLVTDDDQKPLDGVEVTVLFPNGSTKIIKSVDGVISFTSSLQGSVQLTGQDSDFAQAFAVVSILPKEASPSFLFMQLIIGLAVGMAVLIGIYWMRQRSSKWYYR